MAQCDDIVVDLTPVDFDVSITTSPCFDVEIEQANFTLEATSIAGQGPKGDAATIVVGATTTTIPGGSANVINVGNQHAAIFDFYIPTGASGPPGSPGTAGDAATINAGTTTTLPPGSSASVVNVGTVNNAVFNFSIPRGDVGAQGSTGASVTYKGTVGNAAALPGSGNTKGDLWVTNDTGHSWGWSGTAWVDQGPWQGPSGVPGVAGISATATAGTTTTGAPGTQANVTNVGTSSAAVFNFQIPRGDVGATGTTGSPGAPGAAATIAAGTTTTGAPGTNAAVTNVGSSSAAVFNFTIPRGDVGAQGTQGNPGTAGSPGAAATIAVGTTNTGAAGSNATVTNSGSSSAAIFNFTIPQGIQGATGSQGPQGIPGVSTLATTSANGLLKQISGSTTDFVDGTNNCSSLSAAIRPFNAFVTKTSAYTLTVADSGKYFICSGGSWTLTLPAPAAGLLYRVRNDMGITGTTGTITLSPTGGTIDGLASLPLLAQQECTLITDGTNWRTFGLKRNVVLGIRDITSATTTDTILLPSGYRYFELDFTALLASIDGSIITGVLSTDSGGTFITTGYYQEVIYNNAATTLAAAQSANGSGFNVAYVGTTPGAQTQIKLYPGSATQRPSWHSKAHVFSGGTFVQEVLFAGFIASNAAINALKYSMGSGNLTNSFLTVKGVV